MEGRSVKGLGEGVRLGFRNADLSGVFTGRGLSTSKVDVLVGVLVTSPFFCVRGVCLIAGLSRLRGGRLFCLAGFGGEVGGEAGCMGGGWVLACITSASRFNTSLTDSGALIDSSLLFGFIEILASWLTLTASSTMLIKFV